MKLPPIYGYVIWLLPEQERSRELRGIIEELAQTCHSVSFVPHITLTPCPDDIPLAKLKSICEKLAKNVDPLQLDTLEIGSLNNNYQSLYIQIKKSGQLIELRESARKEAGLDQEDSYMPHLSLFYGFLSDKRRSEITDSLKDFIPEKIIANQLVLVQLNGTPDTWQVVYSVSMAMSEKN